jgi:hypothetical protein
MKKDRVWFIICGKRTSWYVISWVGYISSGVAEFLCFVLRLHFREEGKVSENIYVKRSLI